MSPCCIASLFEGIDLPASDEAIKAYARHRASEAEMAIIERFDADRYEDMADIARAFGRALR